MRPIFFATSKTMNLVEKKKLEVKQMIFAIIFGVRLFRSYLLPKQFVILTMDQSFPYVVQHMNFSSRISKWVLELQDFYHTFMVEDSTRASLANVLTYREREKKISPKFFLHEESKKTNSPFEDAFTLFFDGASKFTKGIGCMRGQSSSWCPI